MRRSVMILPVLLISTALNAAEIYIPLDRHFNARVLTTEGDGSGLGMRGAGNEKILIDPGWSAGKLQSEGGILFKLGPLPTNNAVRLGLGQKCEIPLLQQGRFSQVHLLIGGAGLNPQADGTWKGKGTLTLEFADGDKRALEWDPAGGFTREAPLPVKKAAKVTLYGFGQKRPFPNRLLYQYSFPCSEKQRLTRITWSTEGIEDGSGKDAEFALLAITAEGEWAGGRNTGSRNLAYPPEIAAWTQATRDEQWEAGKRLITEIHRAISNGHNKYTAATRHYRFRFVDRSVTNLRLNDVTNFTLDFQGSTLWMENHPFFDEPPFSNAAPGLCLGMRLYRCKDVTVKNLTIDFDPLLQSQGTILTVQTNGSDKYVDLDIDGGFPVPHPHWFTNPSTPAIKAIFYTPDGSRQLGTSMDWIKTLERLDERQVRIRFRSDKPFQWNCPKPGDRQAIPFWIAGRESLSASDCERITYENITIYATAGFTFVESAGAGAHVYRKCRVVRRPETERLLASAVDVIHSLGPDRGPLVEDCEFSHAGDDLLNIHGFFQMVVSRLGPSELSLLQPHGRDFPGLKPGCMVRFLDLDTAVEKFRATVFSLERDQDPGRMASAKDLQSEAKQRFGAELRGMAPDPWRVRFAEVLPPEVERLTLVVCNDAAGSGLRLRNSYLHDTFTMGIRVKAHDVVIENCRFERIGLNAITLMAERYWLEGPFPERVIIRSNTIIESGTRIDSHSFNCIELGAINLGWFGKRLMTAPGFLNREIAIEGNQIVRPAFMAVNVMNASGVRIANNFIETPVAKAPDRSKGEVGFVFGLKTPAYAIHLAMVSNAVLSGNNVLAKDSHPSYLGSLGIGAQSFGVQTNHGVRP